MKVSLLIISMFLCLVLITPGFLTGEKIENTAQTLENGAPVQASATAPQWLTIRGLVENPLNITYAELKTFPLVSEVATLQCVGAGNGSLTRVTCNWTGVPLFYFLSMAKVIPGTYRKVVFVASDNYSSDLLLKTAMEPTTILALWANGTDLEQVSRDWFKFTPGYRLVLPCRWGYKWVRWVTQINVVDYDYKGPWERWFGDDALQPNCTMPQTNPPLQHFGVLIDDDLRVLTNSSIDSFKVDSNWRLVFKVSGLEETHGYLYMSFLKDLLGNPSRVFVDHSSVDFSQTDVDDRIFLFFTFAHSAHTIEIEWDLAVGAGGGGGGAHYLLR